MKKNIGNDKVIRAMAIGISAMLAASTPLTALAAEGEEGAGEGGANEGSQITPSSTVCDDAQAAASEASTAAGKAETSASTVKTDVETTEETKVVAGEAGTDSEGKDLAQKVIDAAEKTEDTTVKGGSSVAGAETYITNTKDQLDVAETNDGLSDAALGTATKEAGNAADIAAGVNDAMDKANATVDEKIGEIENATTIADANAAYSELEATANAAQEEFNTKLVDYNAAKDAYDYAAAKVKEYEKAYNDAIANADANAAVAQAKLAEAQANAAALEAAVAAAKDAVDASAADAMEIAELEYTTRNDGGRIWKNEDQLFIAIMEKYYLPEKLDITGATVTRVQGKDNNEYNYFKAEYTDENGVTQFKYFNYKMDDNNTSKDDIVIFEKREVEIFGGAADQYVDKKGDVIDTAAGLEDGTIVGVNDEYLIKNDATKSETLVSDSEVTGTSKEDIFVDEDNAKESWKLDEEGNLVKTVTADVTTITYTDATFTSDKSYATAAERNKAAADKEAELEKATGKDATITETEETTYTGEGTYIPTFTKTVNVKNEEVESGRIDWLREADSDAEAVAIVKKEQEKVLKEDDDLYIIGNIQSNLSVTGHTKDKWYDDSDYLVSGTVTATYAKVTKETVSQSTFGSLWNDIKALFGGGQSTNEKLKAAAKQAVEAEGGIFVSASWDDWSYNKATIRYVKGVKVTTDEMQTEQAAKGAVGEAALKQAKANGATGVMNVNADAVEHKTYSYTVDYLKKDTETTENKAVETETYGNAEKLTGEIIQNKNYKDKNILLTQKDEKYRAFVDSAKALTDKYDRLLTEANQANADVQEAQKQVKALQEAIEALKGKSVNSDALKDLEAKLVTAKANRDNAEETLNEILKKLEGAGVTLDDVINRLTPPTTPGGADGTTGGGTGTGTTTTTTPGTTTLVAGNVVAAPVATTTTTTTTPAPAAANVVAIEDEDTPLAATVDEAGDDANESGDEDQNAIVAIEDEETPLVASVEKDKVSWWWWLILVILGATGYEMYRKHQEKKKAAAEAEDAE